MDENSDIKVVKLVGGTFEQGYQYGAALKDELHTAAAMCLGGIGSFYSIGKEKVLVRAMDFLPAARAFDANIEPMVQGQAQGSGLSFEEAFALRCTLELMFYFHPTGSALCTSFAANGEATASGTTLLGQNIDWFSGTPLALLKQEHPDGIRQLTLCLVGIAEYTLSSAGYGMCANGTVISWNPPGPRIPLLCYLPRVMRQKSLGNARSLLKTVARGTGYYHLADASGEIFGIESDFSRQCVIEPEKGILVHSNHYLAEQFQRGDGARTIFPDSYERLLRMKNLLAKSQRKLTPDLMKKILGDHQGFPNSICRHPDRQAPPHMRSETLASFLMEPERGVMHLVVGNPCQKQYRKYSL